MKKSTDISKMDTSITKEAKSMKNYLPISHVVWNLYNAILVPSSDYVSTSVKDCRKDFRKKYEETEVVSCENLEKVMEALELLPEKEREIIIQRFGLEDGIPKSLEGVGKVFCVTREYIRQREAKALKMMRAPSRLRKLPALFGFVPPVEPLPVEEIDAGTDIMNLGLSVRSYNCLRRFGHINTVGDILEYPKEGWPKIKNLGRKSALEIQERMREVGYPNFRIETC